MRISINVRKVFIAAFSLFVLLLAAAPAMAEVASFRNEEQVPARLAFMGEQKDGGWIVAGWIELDPDDVFELPMDTIKGDQLYVHVEFADSKIIQFMDDDNPVKEAWVVDEDFEHYAPDTQFEGENSRKATFIKVVPSDGELWFNLNSAAG